MKDGCDALRSCCCAPEVGAKKCKLVEHYDYSQ